MKDQWTSITHSMPLVIPAQPGWIARMTVSSGKLKPFTEEEWMVPIAAWEVGGGPLVVKLTEDKLAAKLVPLKEWRPPRGRASTIKLHLVAYKPNYHRSEEIYFGTGAKPWTWIKEREES